MFLKFLLTFIFLLKFSPALVLANGIKSAEFAGQFYPADQAELATVIDRYLEKADPVAIPGDILAIISPHAGYGYSGSTVAYAYKLIRNQPYKTIVILGTAHRYAFNGFAVSLQEYFSTPLGKIPVDRAFAESLIGRDADIISSENAFNHEHSVEVQLPFLQKALPSFSAAESGGPANDYSWKIVPVVCGDVTLDTCKRFADLLKAAIGDRKDVLIVVSTDMYHGYNLTELAAIDQLTLSYLKSLNSEGLYYGLRDGKLQLCGGFGVVTALILANKLGAYNLEVLKHTNSALAGGENQSNWVVGYASCAIYRKEAKVILTALEKIKLLQIARNSIDTYLKTGKKLELKETDSVFLQELGAFVTLRKNKQLRGCIGNMTAKQGLSFTIRDMAVESAVGDPRFDTVKITELKDINIEISVLTPLERIDSADKIILGQHGVMVRKGYATGVFLPQVAIETGWSKEEFLNRLCVDKAGLTSFAWKDPAVQLYIFKAEVFSEETG